MMNLGSKMKLEEVEDLMKEADPKGEGAIDLEEFAARMCPPKK
jgi:Ca2+-binding EF-hand superfamily protein